ncbi:MAG: type I methionyl aminopeptidase [Candidatus Daviesbacteria bacterium]|nr:type I methionyl aminopeptidase [Candidatus Daviesbacteria bacterium]
MSNNIIKTEVEQKLLRKSGILTARALKTVIENAKPGVTLLELDKLAEDVIKKNGGESSFKTVPGYNFTTCLTVNDEVVHGIPRAIKLQSGDLLSIDVGAIYQGWHTDAAWSIIVGSDELEVGSEKKRFLEVGEETLWKTITQAHEGKRIGDISASIQQGVENAGYNVVQSFSGHGIGTNNHEKPEIPTFGKEKTGLKLKRGMILAIEVIYAEGNGDVCEANDDWTVITTDHSLGGLFEMSVIVGKKGAEILTDWRQI